MASTSVRKKACCKCDKGGGIFTCDGCEKSFCRKHTDEHRQELSIQMDNIGQEHDIIQRDLNKKPDKHPLLSRIDEWERESINKIEQVAKQARIDVNKLIDQSNKDLKTSIDQLTNELQSSRDSEDYTELDLKRWIDRLKEFRDALEKPLALNIIDDDDNRSVIRLIRVTEQLKLHSSERSIRTSDQSYRVLSKSIAGTSERFWQTDEKSVLSSNGLMAMCIVGEAGSDSSVYGIRCYSNDIHHLRFRIEQKESTCLFFGITTHEHANSQLTDTTPSTNGWWDLNCYVKDGRLEGKLSTKTIRTGDEVTLVLDCDHEQIHFTHHRTHQSVKMSIDLQKCPFPWQLFVILNAKGDYVRILDNNNLP